MARDPHPELPPAPPKPVPPVGKPGHEDAMLDEAGDESFPASDPAAPVQPHKRSPAQKKK
jgi:hypothetical protein